MRKTLFVLCLVALLGVSLPVQAQLRQDAQTAPAPVRLYDQGGSTFSLNKFFSPAVFKMGHSVEMTAGSFGGTASSLAMYTNSMQWQFSDKLAARVDMSVAYSPLNNSPASSLTGNNSNGRVFLRNAEIAYKPLENMELHLSFRQSPYGMYASPYGYSPYGNRYGSGYNNFFGASYGSSQDLFWKDGVR